MSFIYAFATIFGWGTWAAVAHDVRSRNPNAKLLYATLGNLAAAAVVFAVWGSPLPARAFWGPFAGGALWSLSGLFAFKAIDRIGLARAVGTWVPINIVVGFVWGALLFGELAGRGAGQLALMGLAFVLLLVGVLLMSPTSGAHGDRRARRRGLGAAAVAGVLWGSYFIPVAASGLDLASAALPMSLGMVAGAVLLALVFSAGAPPFLMRPADYGRAALSGLLWAVGNYGMLLLGRSIGTGAGFAVAQVNLAVSALIGIFLFHEQVPGSPQARRILWGALVATIGGVLIGLAK